MLGLKCHLKLPVEGPVAAKLGPARRPKALHSNLKSTTNHHPMNKANRSHQSHQSTLKSHPREDPKHHRSPATNPDHLTNPQPKSHLPLKHDTADCTLLKCGHFGRTSNTRCWTFLKFLSFLPNSFPFPFPEPLKFPFIPVFPPFPFPFMKFQWPKPPLPPLPLKPKPFPFPFFPLKFPYFPFNAPTSIGAGPWELAEVCDAVPCNINLDLK